MENGFGADFGDVRVHTDDTAARTAVSFGAAALTVGRDVSFGPGRYLPGTAEGDRLIAHELAHVVQQRRGGATPPLDPNAPHERAAERSAEAVAAGRSAPSVGPGTGLGVACGNGTGGGLPALSPDELLRFLLSGRGFGTAAQGPVSFDPKLCRAAPRSGSTSSVDTPPTRPDSHGTWQAATGCRTTGSNSCGTSPRRSATTTACSTLGVRREAQPRHWARRAVRRATRHRQDDGRRGARRRPRPRTVQSGPLGRGQQVHR